MFPHCLPVRTPGQINHVKSCRLSGLVTERLARFSYGIGTTKDFVKGKHPEEKRRTTEDGINYCDDIFDPFISEGEQFTLSQVIEKKYYPRHKNQNHLKFEIFKSPRRIVQYTDEFRVTQIGSLSIAIQKPNES